MNIKGISEPHITYYVETDERMYHCYYRTNETGEIWENAMGESWESCHGDKEAKLKEMFREFMSKQTL